MEYTTGPSGQPLLRREKSLPGKAAAALQLPDGTECAEMTARTPSPGADKLASQQKALGEALLHFLYGSLAERLGACLDAAPLARCLSEFCGDHPEEAAPDRLQDSGMVEERLYARRLASLHRMWEGLLNSGDLGPVERKALPAGWDYPDWLRQGGENRRYGPVHRLRDLVTERASALFLRAAVHGSVGTLDDTPGFSDLDTVFVIRASVLKDAEKLMELRRRAGEILTWTYAFDPWMHHGPYYLSEIDLRWYPEAYFPLILFRYGVDLLPAKEEQRVSVRPSGEVTGGLQDLFEAFFSEEFPAPLVLKSRFDLEWVLGSAMFLPALYLQEKTGQFRYKRDTFPLAEKDFSEREWEPIRVASRLRATLAARPRLPRFWVRGALRLRRPGLLRRAALRLPLEKKRVADAARVLGPHYSEQVLRLLRAMRGKLAERTDGRNDGGQSAGRAAVSLEDHFAHLSKGPHSSLPEPVPAERYAEAVQVILGRWSRMAPRPLAVYQLGGVDAPGISDLDFVIVFPKRTKFLPGALFEPDRFPEWVHPLMTHPPYCCGEDLWPLLPGWFPAFRLRHLWGDRLPEPSVPESSAAGCALGMLADYLMIKIPSDILYMAWGRPVPLRFLIATLSSAAHTFRLAERAAVSLPADAPRAVSEISSLKRHWFERDPSRRLEDLAELCVRTCRLTGELILQVDRLLSDLFRGAGEAGSGAGSLRGVLFEEAWTLEEAVVRARRIHSARGKIVWTVPSGFRNLLALYADECPALAEHFRVNVPTRRPFVPEGGAWEDGLRFHARALGAYGKDASLLGVPPQRYLALGYSSPRTFWMRARRHALRVMRGELSVRSAARGLMARAARRL